MPEPRYEPTQGDARVPSSSGKARPVDGQASLRPDWNGRRFRQFFPWSSLVTLSPLWAGVVLGFFAITLWKTHPNASLALIAFWVGLLMFNVDRPLLGSYGLAPVASLGLRQMIGLGYGLFLVSFSASFVSSAELRHMLIHGIFGGLGKLAGAAIAFRSGRGLYIPLENPTYQRDVLRPIVLVGWLLIGYTMMTVVVTLFVWGGADRAKATVWQVDEALGWWSWFNLFNNLKYSLWVIVPLIWLRSSSAGRIALVAACLLLVLPDFLGGSRTAIVAPAMYIVFGIAMFWPKPFNLDKYLLVAVIPLVTFVAFWEFYRGSDAFRDTKLVNFRDRIASIPKAWDEYRQKREFGSEADENKVAGWSVYRYLDPIVYTRTPSDIPFAGWSEWATPQQILVPTFFWRSKPQMVDGNTICVRYMNLPPTRTGTGVSLNADLYRRFGDIGVPIGNFIVGLMYGLILRVVYGWYHRRNAVAGLVTIIFFGAQGNFGLLDNVCNSLMYGWMYIIPKQVLGIMLFSAIARAISAFPVVGADSFAGRLSLSRSSSATKAA